MSRQTPLILSDIFRSDDEMFNFLTYNFMSTLSIILLVLFLLTGFSAIILIAISFHSEDSYNKLMESGFFFSLASIIFAFALIFSVTNDRSHIKKKITLSCENYSVEEVITTVESSADSEVKADTTYIIRCIPKR